MSYNPLLKFSPVAFDYSDSISSNLLTTTDKNCTADKSVIWIYNLFGQCILSNLEMIGFYFGLLSIICWMSSTIPQLVLNCKSGNADKALSFYFLFFWLAGDTCNMVGCILASQLPIQILTGVYYILMDLIMIIQYLYLCKIKNSDRYRARNRSQNRIRRDSEDSFLDNTDLLPDDQNLQHNNFRENAPLLMMFVPFVNVGYYNADKLYKFSDLWNIQNAYDSATINANLGANIPFNHDQNLLANKNAAIGYTLGIISCIFYMISRLPQITRNFKRGSTQGVSISMFILAILGNFLYGTSVLLSKHAEVSFAEYIKLHLPWLIGSYGTMALDLTIVAQCLYLKGKNNHHGRYRGVNDTDEDEHILRDSE